MFRNIKTVNVAWLFDQILLIPLNCLQPGKPMGVKSYDVIQKIEGKEWNGRCQERPSRELRIPVSNTRYTVSQLASEIQIKYYTSTDHTKLFSFVIPTGVKEDCWICYDTDRTDAGALIQPCQCRGDVASVHHECLRKWLIEVHHYVQNITVWKNTTIYWRY